ncbi:hypothetical protein KDA_54920 [Dictyobacter alpinus]|uniref:Uncharacterized protein n=1 Tax=Dictyobacter alpinus TaxID=2014873 RepID=A0A402BF39_9CHLR|nr:hypothetical protein [Dictyobacter alpinus]GCE30008.1 hypothetical protein KDA_54920 [Dictyobacter alpinus]
MLVMRFDYFTIAAVLCSLTQLWEGAEKLAAQQIPLWQDRPVSWKYHFKQKKWGVIGLQEEQEWEMAP